MTNVEKVRKILESDFYISYWGFEITEYDEEDEQFLCAEDNETYTFKEINEAEADEFIVYDLERMDFPEDIFEYGSLIKKMKKVIETDKEKIQLFVDEIQVLNEGSLDECTEMDFIAERYEFMEFYHKEVQKNYFSKMKD